MQRISKHHKIKPGFKIILGFFAIITIGALLLHLPIATIDNDQIPLIDCFFTSASAVCVTGLAVFPPGLTLSGFGQAVLLALIQLGGLGFMTATSMILLIIGKKFSLHDRITISSSFGEEGNSGVVRLMRNAVIVTFSVETLGAVILSLRFIPQFGIGRGIWYSFFHAISAFCNAGFDVLQVTDNLISYNSDPLVCLTICGLIIIGGLGFLVVIELTKRFSNLNKKRTFLSMHTKVVLSVTAFLLLSGTLLFLIFEWDNEGTMGNMSIGDKMLNSFFQSVTARTAGFSSVDQGALLSASKLVTIILMVIGASPAGTGGGFKTTTLAVMFALFRSVIRGKRNISLFRRSISRETIYKSLALILMVVGAVLLLTVSICAIEGSKFTMDEVMFEVCSAFGTVGLSCGITAALDPFSKLLLIIAMFFGRIGMHSLLTGVNEQFSKNTSDMEYPEGKILIG